MNKIKSLLAAVLIIVTVCVPVGAVTGLIVSGCSTDAQRATYGTTAITHASVRAAMAGWSRHVASGKATIQDEQKVKAAYEKYRQSQLAIINTAQAFGKAGAVDPTAQDRIQATLDASGKALAELIGLLNTYGITTE